MPANLPRFARRFAGELPGDASTELRSRQVHGALWSEVSPTPVRAPRLLAFSRPLARELGLDEALFADRATAEVLAGNRLWPGMAPFAANYGGHQFGHWAGQLGDGRAIVLGELERPDGALVELQLKGAGPTPYSRAGDGRAVLRSSLREFLCSEAMHHLGVPTTRALSLCATGDVVVRDMFYDGNPKPEPGAIVCRVAPTFLRFGNFELPSARGDVALLRTLAEFTRRHFFAELPPPSAPTWAAWLHEVAVRTARLIAHWQAVGFVHGVMNTDNLSILGLTIDYGPYGWLDGFDPGWTPNTTDAQHRRYAYGNQPGIGLWNVERLGAALLPLLDGDEEPVHAALEAYRGAYAEAATGRFAAKIGLTFEAARGDGALLQQLLDWLAAQETDMTLFFRALASVAELPATPTTLPDAVQAAFYRAVPEAHTAAGVDWLRRWWARTRQEPRAPAEVAAAMQRVNPKYVLRNWLAQTAIDAAEAGDLAPLHRLLAILERPFDEQPEHAELAQKRPDWARDKPGCSALSCSS
ncbi:MAG: YdiU family protein [Planctomycetes bacterium]|nr:YdiU family protein [Planctomycetota bacterium]